MNRFTRLAVASAVIATAVIAYATTTDKLALNKTTPTTAANTTATTSAAKPDPAANVSPEERAKMESVIHQYLITKPEVLVEALQVLQKRQFEEAQKTVKQTQQIAANFVQPLFHQANDPFSGNPNGKITVVEFFDYQCPHCAGMAPTLDAIAKANPEVKIIYKEFAIRGPMSEYASKAALAANKQGKYLEFSHALFKLPNPLTQESILQAAKDTGLDVEQLKKDMAGKEIEDQLKANTKLGTDLKLFGTPAFFIGKTDTQPNGTITYFPGEMKQEQLQTEIDKAKT